MNGKTLASRLMFAGGLILILVGLLHFLWAFDWNETEPITSLPDDFRTLFILMTAVIGLLLVFVGLMTLYFSQRLRHGDRSAEMFGLLVGCLLLARLVLEFILPVRVPLSFFPNPLPFKALIFLGVAAMFIIPLCRLKFKRSRSTAP